MIQEKLQTKILGKHIIFFEEINSTQKKAKELIGTAENGTIVIAQKQTEGIGTHGRVWYTGEDSIAFTLILYPNCSIEKLENITYEIANVMIETIQELYSIVLEIKLPNDIVYENKKIAGILTQTNLVGEKVNSMLIGLGMNINGTSFPKELEKIATSIYKEFGIKVNKEDIIVKFLEKLEKIYEKII